MNFKDFADTMHSADRPTDPCEETIKIWKEEVAEVIAEHTDWGKDWPCTKELAKNLVDWRMKP